MHIRKLLRSDTTQLAELIKEHAKELNMENEAMLTNEYLTLNYFDSNPPSFQCYVATEREGENESLIAYIIYYDAYSTWLGKTMMVDDFYVVVRYREEIFLRAIVAVLTNYASSDNYNRLEFRIMSGDFFIPFIQLRNAKNLAESNVTVHYRYDGKDHTESERWLCYRLPGDIMHEMAKEYKEFSG